MVFPEAGSSRNDRASSLAWAVGLAIASVLVIALAWQVRQLRAERDWLLDRTTQPYAGMYVPRIPMRSIDGDGIVLGQPRGDVQVAYFFNTTCPYCLRSVPGVQDLARRIAAETGSRIELVGIAYDSPKATRAYLARHRFDFPVVASTDRRTSMLFRARSIPTFLVIGRDGRIRHSKTGALASMEGIDAILSAARRKDAPAAATTREIRR